MFNWIWDSRPHFSEISGKPLLHRGHSMWHFQFLHVLPKGTFPKYKLNPENIMLGTPEEHNHQERHQEFNDKKDSLRREYYEKFYGKEY